MLSRDASGLKPDSSTAKRWRLLRDAGVELEVIVASRGTGSWEETGLKVRGTGGDVLTKWWNAWKLARYAAHGTRYDLVTAQDPFELGLIGHLLSSKLHIPFEIQDHGGFFDGEKADEPLWSLRSRMASWLAKRANLIRTVSPRSLDELKKDGSGKKVYWMPISAESRFAGLERAAEPFHVVSVGRLVTVKDFDLLIKSFAMLKQRHGEARLTIVGEGAERRNLEDLVQSLDLVGSVDLPGAGDPAPFLKKAAVFVMLSRHEGWGIASIEAALAGVPIVMTDTGCARWLEKRVGASVVSTDEKEPEKISRSIEAQAKSSGMRLDASSLETQEQATATQVARWSELC